MHHPAGGGKERPAWFGRLCAACDPDMIAYAQLEVMAMLPSLQVAKLQQPPKIDGGTIKVCSRRSHPSTVSFTDNIMLADNIM